MSRPSFCSKVNNFHRKLKANNYKLEASWGFSVIEMLVVISTLVLLTSILVLYNRTGERHIIVLREQAQLIGTILRAKSFAINTLVEDAPACGYGVHADIGTGTYFIYRDRTSPCSASDRQYGDASDEKVDGTEVALDSAVRFATGGLADIEFVPPDPQVFLDGGTALAEGSMILETADGASRVTVIISNAGQISG